MHNSTITFGSVIYFNTCIPSNRVVHPLNNLNSNSTSESSRLYFHCTDAQLFVIGVNGSEGDTGTCMFTLTTELMDESVRLTLQSNQRRSLVVTDVTSLLLQRP